MSDPIANDDTISFHGKQTSIFENVMLMEKEISMNIGLNILLQLYFHQKFIFKDKVLSKNETMRPKYLYLFSSG